MGNMGNKGIRKRFIPHISHIPLISLISLISLFPLYSIAQEVPPVKNLAVPPKDESPNLKPATPAEDSTKAGMPKSSSLRIMTLEEVVSMAKEGSPASKQAHAQYANSYWTYRTYKSNYLPQLGLNGTVPSFNRGFNPYTYSDGHVGYIQQSSASSNLNLGLSQNIGLTGSNISVGSNLARTDNFTGENKLSYAANPLFISFNQPSFKFNPYKWDQKIQPMVYEESKRQFIENMESVAEQATGFFFGLLLAQVNLEIAQKNLANNDTLYHISMGRYNLGKIAENDLLQMELSVMTSQNAVSQGMLDVQLGMLQLKNFLKIQGNDSIFLIEPINIPQFNVDLQQAMLEAKQNRSDIIAIELGRVQAEYSLAQAKGTTGFVANLQASYGLTNSTIALKNLYNKPQDQQNLIIGFTLPIVDWGLKQSKIRTAIENKNVADIIALQAEQKFEQDIFLLVTQFGMYREKLKIAIKSDTIAMKRYDITMKRYMIGKVGILDLNLALQEQIQSKRSYVQALSDFWSAYYDLRKKTLYDFERNSLIKY